MEKYLINLKRKAPSSPPSSSQSDLDDLDNLPWDPADRKRISEYNANQKNEFPNWLEYSVKKDAAFCLYCYLFRDNAGKGGRNDAWTVDGFSSWNKAKNISEHVGAVNSFHNNAAMKCENLMKQGLPFRGHEEKDETANNGNFVELLKYTAEQNEDVKLVKSIIDEIDHDVFGLLVDESADVSYKEQMAVVFRYVDKSGIVKERFISLTHVSDTSSSSLKSAIDSLFAKYGLSITKVRGQGYDGAMGASCKRKDAFRENHKKTIEKEVNDGERKTGKGLNQDVSVQRPGMTRWSSHYRTLLRVVECFSSILQEFNDRFNEVNTKLLICAASLSPIDSFSQFDHSKLMRLSTFYPSDFSQGECISLDQQLDIYIDNLRNDERFTHLEDLGELARTLVETRKHLSFPLVYRLLKLILILPVATATVERSFSAMKIVKTDRRNRIGDEFLNDCLICFIEKDVFEKVTNEAVMKRFQDMKDRRVFL
ncbi:uncharacterized protein LOC108834751 [Raphanus sativus]|uniref:Uncharacterized protein LOC108834751 n=1 Tax=Raphanus sativus TaxID=3726 RepID=A0A9W3CRQ7_RAPSA|nr:uncharacterized protein LOC108834751 [Raphanus sativus]